MAPRGVTGAAGSAIPRAGTDSAKGGGMAEHDDKAGDQSGMDITEQERTYAKFMVWLVRGIAVVVAILLILALFAI